MKGLYVYAITDRPIRISANGIHRRRLRTVPASGMHAIVENAVRAPKPTLDKLKAQTRVLARVMRTGATLIPARFGSYVAGRADLDEALRHRRRELRAALRRVRGCVQISIRFTLAAAPRPTASKGRISGTAFMTGRVAAARARANDPFVRGLRRAAKPFVREEQIDWPDTPGATAVIHHLVPHSRLDAYVTRMAAEIIRSGVDAVMSGPWAPFAFAEVV